MLSELVPNKALKLARVLRQCSTEQNKYKHAMCLSVHATQTNSCLGQHCLGQLYNPEYGQASCLPETEACAGLFGSAQVWLGVPVCKGWMIGDQYNEPTTSFSPHYEHCELTLVWW